MIENQTHGGTGYVGGPCPTFTATTEAQFTRWLRARAEQTKRASDNDPGAA